MSRHKLLLVAILLAQFVIPLSISGTAVALPRIADDLGSAIGPLQWVVNGFNVAFAACTIPWGAFSDRLGYSRSFRVGIAVAVTGSALSVSASSLVMLDVGRVVAGVGAAAVLTGAAPLLTHLFNGAARARAFALFGTINGLGLAAGPALSGVLLSAWGWRGIFATHGAALLIAFVATTRLPRLGRSGASLRELLDFSALKAPQFVSMLLVPVAGAVGFVTYLTYLPSALSGVYALSPSTVGVLMLAMTVPVLVAPTIVHRIIADRRVTPTSVIAASFGCLIVGAVGVLALFRPDIPVAASVIPMLLLGLGFGLPLGFVDAEALAAVPADRAGGASGVFNLARIGAEAVFVAAYAAILSAIVLSELPGRPGQLTVAGTAGHAWVYRSGLVVTTAVMLALVALTAIAFAILTRSRRTLSNRTVVNEPSA